MSACPITRSSWSAETPCWISSTRSTTGRLPDPRDYIPTFAESLRFAQVAGVITAAEAKRLGTRPAGAELRRLHDLRARLERVFRAVLDGRAPLSEDLDALARDAAAAARTARLRTLGGQLTRTIDPTVAGLATLRLRLVEAAVTLLTSERFARLGACPELRLVLSRHDQEPIAALVQHGNVRRRGQIADATTGERVDGRRATSRNETRSCCRLAKSPLEG